MNITLLTVAYRHTECVAATGLRGTGRAPASLVIATPANEVYIDDYGGFLVESYNYIAQLADYPWKFRGQLTNLNVLITYQFQSINQSINLYLSQTI